MSLYYCYGLIIVNIIIIVVVVVINELIILFFHFYSFLNVKHFGQDLLY